MHTKLNLVVTILTALALSAVARAQSSVNPSSSSGAEQTTTYLSSEEAKFLQIINSFRKGLGLNELRIHVGLQTAADKHSHWMALKDSTTHLEALSHFGPTPTTEFSDRIEVEGYANYTMLGENVACGSASAEDTFKQFAFSPAHLENMMNPRYRHIGVARDGTGNELCPYYWTTDFGSKANPNTDLPAVTDITKIASAIDDALGNTSTGGQTTALLLAGHSATNTPPEARPSIVCVVPYSMGRNVLVSSVDTLTTLELTSNLEGYMMKVSFQQENSTNRYQPFSMSGTAVLKNPFYPLLTVFSAPNSRMGGFIIQIDTATGRAQFDPYVGHGGASGLISCKTR